LTRNTKLEDLNSPEPVTIELEVKILTEKMVHYLETAISLALERPII
jgi:hypothetical protein